MRKRLFGYIIPLIFTVVIVLAGALLPDMLLTRTKGGYTKEDTVPAAAVKPFGDAYEETRDSLTEAVQMKNEIYNLISKDGEYILFKNSADTYALSAKETAAQEFIACWTEYCPSLAKVTDTEAGIKKRSGYYEGIPNHGMICYYYFDEVYGTESRLITDEKTGLPVAIRFNIRDCDSEDAAEMWESLTSAFFKKSGLVFSLIEEAGSTPVPTYMEAGIYASAPLSHEIEISDAAADIYLGTEEAENIDKFLKSFTGLSSDGVFVLSMQISYYDTWCYVDCDLESLAF